MALEKFDRFVKVMMLTTSPIEGEALSATRMANSMLAAANLNWEEFLNARAPAAPPSPPATSGKHHVDEDIDEMFESVSANLDPESSFCEFIESLHEWWEKKGFLTEKQYAALKNSYERMG